MGDIYRRSVLNISAGGSEDCNGGCFTTINPLRHRPCILVGDEQGGMVVTGSCPSEWRNYENSTTLSRGLVFQERMLAPRTLHYGKRMISWECICCDATQGWPEGDTWDWNKDKRYRRPKEIFESLAEFCKPADDSSSSFAGKTVETFYHAWAELVSSYNSKKLTQRDDKIVALHGIISKIADYTGLRNVAGLWLDYLPLELLWSTGSPDKKRSNFFDPDLYRAPTWSWASVDTGACLNYPELTRGRTENILGMSFWASYRLAWEANILGVESARKAKCQVTKAVLNIEGRLRKIEWQENSRLGGYKYNRQTRRITDRWLPGFRMGTSWEIWGLLLMHGTGPSNCKDARIDVGLVLEPVEGKDRTFRPFGYFEQCFWEGDTYPIFRDNHEEVRKAITII